MSGPELVGLAACAVTFSAWSVVSRGAVDWAAIGFFVALSYVSTMVGRLALTVLLPRGPRPDFPTQFLCGFFLLSSALFFLSLATPFGIVGNSLIVTLAAVVWRVAVTPAAADVPSGDVRMLPGMMATLVSLLAASLWSADAIQPIVESRGTVVFKPWSDCFVHASMVRMFRDAHGFRTLGNIMLPGQPAQVYHYAAYAVPALLAAVSDTPCYLAMTSFLIPLGLVLTGFAAFALVRSLWGPGAGLAATVALLLLPDPSFWGLRNSFLSYHWLQQVAPTGTYGVALAALAWLLFFEGCRRRSVLIVGVSLVAAGLVLFYKAHIFVAIAFLIWVAAPLLMPHVRLRWRIVWFVAAVAFFLAVTSLARYVPAVPILRLDGSGMRDYVNKVAHHLREWPIRPIFSVTTSSSRLEMLLKGSTLLFLSTFGVLGLVCLILTLSLIRRSLGAERAETQASGAQRVAMATALFPVVVILNYLVMSLGLAVDQNAVTQADELLHRPLVWAYFVVVAWTGGALYEVVIKPWLERSWAARRMVVVAVLGLFVVPLYFGQDVQVGPGWGKEFTNTTMPVSLYRCALFLRERSGRREVIQDSGRDLDKALSALSERPEFVVDYPDSAKRALLAGRLEAVRRLERIVDVGELKHDASSEGIDWYILRPDNRVAWPPFFLGKPAFQAGVYRVYSLTGSAK